MSIDTKTTEIPKTLAMVKPDIFAKGGDRVAGNMPDSELEICKRIGCQVVYNVGHEKETSSQELVRKYLE